MTRPRKQTVDYFPHYVRHGQTMEILEQKYGLSGYAFWFKLLERLGDTDGHFLDCKNPIVWNFLQSKTHQDEKTTVEILNLLSDLQAIDAYLWKHGKIIWCQNFVDNIADAYRNRVIDIPPKPTINKDKSISNGVSDVRNPERRGEERIEEKTLVRNSSDGDNGFSIFWKNYPKKIGKKAALNAWKKARGKPPLKKIVDALAEQKASVNWLKDDGQYIPNPATWINQGRWDDEVTSGQPTSHLCNHGLRIEECKICRDHIPQANKGSRQPN
jgi:hypothetical protein